MLIATLHRVWYRENQEEMISNQWNRGRIRALRHHLGLTQAEMAEQLGIRQQTVSEWETGQYEPRGTSVTVLRMVAERSRFEYGVDDGDGMD